MIRPEQMCKGQAWAIEKCGASVGIIRRCGGVALCCVISTVKVRCWHAVIEVRMAGGVCLPGQLFQL